MRVLLVALLTVSLAAPASALAADGQPKKALTKAGQTTARSVVLKRGDLGTGFTSVERTRMQHLPKGARCGALDETDLTVTGDAASPDFRFAQPPLFVTVGSTAQVYRTLREANTSWNRGSTRRRPRASATSSGSPRGGAEDHGRVGEEDPVPVGVAEDGGVRSCQRTVSGDRRVRAYVDAVILQHGRIQSGLLFTSFGSPVGNRIASRSPRSSPSAWPGERPERPVA